MTIAELKELETAIAKYQDLASRTQSGYDIEDLGGLYHQVSMEYSAHRDTKFCAFFESLLTANGCQTLKLPTRSPNLNAFAGR